MATIAVRNGKLVIVNGNLGLAPACCCDDDCPHCPPIGSIPHLCELIIETRLGLYHLHNTAGIQEWVKLDVTQKGDLGFDTTHCVYFYEADVYADECIGTCEDNACVIDLEPIECNWNSFIICPDPGNPGESISCPATVVSTLTGKIKIAERNLISNGTGRVRFAIDCTTGIKYRWITFRFDDHHAATGRIVGKIEDLYTADVTDPVCPCTSPVLVTTHLNDGDPHACDECPQLNDLEGEEYDDGHQWTLPRGIYTWSPFGGHFAVLGGDDSWVVVDEVFDPYSASTWRGANSCFLTANSLVGCKWPVGEEQTVVALENFVEWEITCPSTWEWWTCDEENPGAFKSDMPYPQPYISITEIMPDGEDCMSEGGDCICENDPIADRGGVSYTDHAITFDLSYPTCVPTQPEEAVPCE